MADYKPTPPLGLVLSLCATMTLALAGLYLIRWLVPADWLHANNEVAGNYLQTLGTVYAVLLAFVVFVVWQQHNEVRGAIEVEANELSDMLRIVRAFPEGLGASAGARLLAYGNAVIQEEWTTLAEGRESRTADDALEAIWQALLVIEPKTERETVLYSEALARFNDLSDARSRRLHCSRLRLPPTLWALLVSNGALVVGSMWLFGLGSFLAHALMTAALAGSIGFILYLIADLDNPFWGAWQVTTDAFQRVLDRWARDTER